MSNAQQWRKPFRRAGTSFWWARLPVADGSNCERSLGVKDKRQAVQALSVLAASYNGSFRVKSLVFAVGRGDISVAEFLDAHSRGELEALAYTVDNPDVDLGGHVNGWQEWLRTRGSTTEGTRAKYLQQLRAFVPHGAAFPTSQFTRKRISLFLSELAVGAPNRYRAALSSFGKYLVEREVLDANPVRDVQSAKEHAPRLRYLARSDAQSVIGAIVPAGAAAAHALMCGSGVEVGAVLKLRRRDVDLELGTVHAHGTKRLHRDRVVRVPESWCWQLLADHVRSQMALPDARVFDLSYRELTEALKAACAAVGVTNYRSHDWRHTYAVQARRDGYSDQVIAHQLGHKTTAMVQAVYGRYSPTASDYQRSQTFRLTVDPSSAAKVDEKDVAV